MGFLSVFPEQLTLTSCKAIICPRRWPLSPFECPPPLGVGFGLVGASNASNLAGFFFKGGFSGMLFSLQIETKWTHHIYIYINMIWPNGIIFHQPRFP